MTRPLLLLAAPSRESRDKADHLAAAARQLGLPVQSLVCDSSERLRSSLAPESGRFAIACSDVHAVTAAEINVASGNDGLSIEMTSLLVDKATGIPALARLLDLPMLPQCLPQSLAEIAAWPHRGALIVKPTRSSGGWSRRPWGYRCFPTKEHFSNYLVETGSVDAFLAEQSHPGADGPCLLQAALDTPRVSFATLLLTPRQAVLVCSGDTYFEPAHAEGHGRRWSRAIYHLDPAATLRRRLPWLRLQPFGQAGWGRCLLHVQAIEDASGCHLIDIQPRVCTSWDWMIAALDPTAHRRLLAALLFDDVFDPGLPAPVVALDLLHVDSAHPLVAIDHPPLPTHIRPVRLTPQACGSSAGAFDKAGMAPAFITMADDVATCSARADAFRHGIRLRSGSSQERTI